VASAPDYAGLRTDVQRLTSALAAAHAAVLAAAPARGDAPATAVDAARLRAAAALAATAAGALNDLIGALRLEAVTLFRGGAA